MAHITTMAQRAFTLLKLIPYSPKYVAKRAHAPTVKGFPPGTLERIRNEDTKRQSPSHMRLYSVGDCIGKHRFGRSSSQESNSSLRSGASSPRMQAAPPSPPPATTRPVPIKVQLPVQASWLHDHWKPAQLEGQVRARIALFEGLASAPTSPASSRPSSPVTTRSATPPPAEQAPVQRKVSRKAPQPPVSESPTRTAQRAAWSSGKSKRAPLPPVQTPVPVRVQASVKASTVSTRQPSASGPLAVQSVKSPLATKAPPPPVLPTETGNASAGASASVTSSLNADFKVQPASLLDQIRSNKLVKDRQKKESTLESVGTSTLKNPPTKASSTLTRKAQVYPRGADVNPFFNQLQSTLSKKKLTGSAEALEKLGLLEKGTAKAYAAEVAREATKQESVKAAEGLVPPAPPAPSQAQPSPQNTVRPQGAHGFTKERQVSQEDKDVIKDLQQAIAQRLGRSQVASARQAGQ